jgi:hypothetical protein
MNHRNTNQEQTMTKTETAPKTAPKKTTKGRKPAAAKTPAVPQALVEMLTLPTPAPAKPKAQPKVKEPAVYAHSLSWMELEDDREGKSVLVKGYELEVTKENEAGTQWGWLVRLTSAISETPELLDAGEAKSEAGAKNRAATAVNKSVARRRKAKAQA